MFVRLVFMDSNTLNGLSMEISGSPDPEAILILLETLQEIDSTITLEDVIELLETDN